MTRTCPNCGRPTTRRTYCSHRCYTDAKSAKWHDLLDLVELGEAPLQALARVGGSPGAAAKWFYRAGHTDLARVFNRIDKAQRQYTPRVHK